MRCFKPVSSTALVVALAAVLLLSSLCAAQQNQPPTAGIPYLKLTTPRRVLPDAQPWEGKEFPHSMSVLELKRGGYRYWGWYGLNEGGGIGLARSNDLVNWIKYGQNPLLTNARWPSVLEHANPAHPSLLYVAFTRNYDTPTSHVVLGATSDGIHITEVRTLVQPVPSQRNQNPNLFRDPRNHRFYLTWYRGNDKDHFEIVSRNAASVEDLDKAPDKVLIRSQETVAAPTLLYLKHARDSHGKKGVYYLATEIYPHRYTDNPEGEWQVKVFAADAPDGNFLPVEGDPVLRGQRACLFQHVFHGRFYGYDCHLETPDHWVLEEVEAPLP
jgi:hypothetical protein